MNIYNLLNIPFVYNLSQIILAPGKRQFMKKIWNIAFDLNLSPVLDVGCGPKLIGPRPIGELYGADINVTYLNSYLEDSKKTNIVNGKSSTIIKECSSTNLPFDSDFFQEIRANGFLHHMSDSDVILSAKEMYRCLGFGGQLVILEDVWPRSKFKRPLAWLIRKFDRGNFMRREDELIDLFRQAIGEPVISKRYTYTLLGAELCILKWVKS